MAQAATGARLTCLGSFNPASASSGKTSTAAKVAAHVDGKAKHQDASEQPSAREPTAGYKAQKAKAEAAEGVAHNGVVEFPDKISRKKRPKQHKALAKMESKAGSVTASSKLKSRKGLAKRQSDVRALPKRKQQM